MTQVKKNFLRRYVRPALFGLAVSFYLAAGLAFVIPKLISGAEAKAQYPCFDEKTCIDKTYGVGGDFEKNSECPGNGGYCYAKIKPYTLIVPFGGNYQIVDIGDYIKRIYDYATGIASVVAAVFMMIGGFQILTAGGDSSRVTAGKQKVTDALVGLFLALGAYLLLNTINPDLVKLQLPRVPVVKKQLFLACHSFEFDEKCGTPFGLVAVEGKENAPNIRDRFKISPDSNECIGRSCSTAGTGVLGDKYLRCRPSGSYVIAQKTNDVTTDLTPFQMGNEHECGGCRKYGTDCQPNGPNDMCCGGFCSNGKCTNGNLGDSCNKSNECKTGVCQTSYGNKCTTGGLGVPCNDSKECNIGYTCITGVGYNICAPTKVPFGFCNQTYDCAEGQTCNTIGHMCDGTGDKKGLPNGARCTGSDTGNDMCQSGTCVGSVQSTRGGMCTDRQLGSACDTKEQCDSRHCAFHICTNGLSGDPCGPKSDGGDCASGYVCHQDVNDVSATANPGRCIKK